MAYALREGISFCVAAGRHFFLDRGADRYFALGPGDEQLFSQICGLDASLHDALILTPALARLLCVGEAQGLKPFRLAAGPLGGMEAHAPVRPGRLLVLRAALSFILVRCWLARRSPGQILDVLARRAPSRPAAPADHRLLSLAAAFEQFRPWTRQDQCLARSLAYVRMANAMGLRVEIVFGITPRPFGAHCWVQADGHVLNDHGARVVSFTPIYAQ